MLDKSKNHQYKSYVINHFNNKSLNQKTENYFDKDQYLDGPYDYIKRKYFKYLKGKKVLDCCCGTGATINYLKINNNLDLYGFDISDFLIDGSKKFKIDHSKIKVADATNTQYNNNEFEYSYSIGSLEHFTEKGIDLFLKETCRITSKISLHQIPISRDPEFQGWLKLDQSYFNMSQEWWEEKFKKYFSKVEVVDSLWADPISLGKWFICYK